MSNQLSQVPIEVLRSFSTASVPAQLSQLPVEALRPFDTASAPGQLSQLPIEVLHSSIAATTDAQLSQLPVELLLQPPPGTVAQLSQLPLEALLPGEVVRAAQVFTTQLATELAAQQPAGLDATQLAVEVTHHQLDSAVRATQALIEIAWKHTPIPPRLEATQLLIEIIRRPYVQLPPETHPPRASSCPVTFPID